MSGHAWVEKAREALTKALNFAVGKDVDAIRDGVDAIKRKNPLLSNIDVAKKVARRRTWCAGIIGAAYGAGGLFTIVPDLFTVWRIHGRLTLAIAHTFGYDLRSPERRDEIVLIMGIAMGNKEAKDVGLEEGKHHAERAAGKVGVKTLLQNRAAKEAMKKLPGRIIMTAGQRSIMNVARLVPLLGIIVNGVIDFMSTRAVGKAAIEYYSQ